MDILTVKQLCAVLVDECKKGNGSKKILISDDDEGNGYHGLFFGCTPTKKIFAKEYKGCWPHIHLDIDSEKELYNDYITLG